MDNLYYLLNSKEFERFLIIAGVVLLAALFIFILIQIIRKINKRVIAGLSYERSFDVRGLYEGDTAILTETIYNSTIFPVFFIKAETYLYSELAIDDAKLRDPGEMIYVQSKFFLILPFMQIKRRHNVLCVKRGYYRLETAKLRQFKLTRDLDASAEIYVYPRLIDVGNLALPVSTMMGELISQRRLISDPFEISGIREYRPGDPFNSINFKATAKSCAAGYGGIKVNARDYCSGRSIMIYMNFMIRTDEKIDSAAYEYMTEYGLSFAASLVNEAESRGFLLGFAANCTVADGRKYLFFPISGGESHMKEILEAMALTRPAPGISASALLDLGNTAAVRNSDIVFITQFTDNDTDERIEQLRRAENSINIIKLQLGDEYEKIKPKKATVDIADSILRRRA